DDAEGDSRYVGDCNYSADLHETGHVRGASHAARVSKLNVASRSDRPGRYDSGKNAGPEASQHTVPLASQIVDEPLLFGVHRAGKATLVTTGRLHDLRGQFNTSLDEPHWNLEVRIALLASNRQAAAFRRRFDAGVTALTQSQDDLTAFPLILLDVTLGEEIKQACLLVQLISDRSSVDVFQRRIKTRNGSILSHKNSPLFRVSTRQLPIDVVYCSDPSGKLSSRGASEVLTCHFPGFVVFRADIVFPAPSVLTDVVTLLIFSFSGRAGVGQVFIALQLLALVQRRVARLLRSCLARPAEIFLHGFVAFFQHRLGNGSTRPEFLDAFVVTVDPRCNQRFNNASLGAFSVIADFVGSKELHHAVLTVCDYGLTAHLLCSFSALSRRIFEFFELFLERLQVLLRNKSESWSMLLKPL